MAKLNHNRAKDQESHLQYRHHHHPHLVLLFFSTVAAATSTLTRTMAGEIHIYIYIYMRVYVYIRGMCREKLLQMNNPQLCVGAQIAIVACSQSRNESLHELAREHSFSTDKARGEIPSKGVNRF